MWREGDDNGTAAGGSRTVGQSTEHFAVRQMQTVEHAQTDHRIGPVREIIQRAVCLHYSSVLDSDVCVPSGALNEAMISSLLMPR